MKKQSKKFMLAGVLALAVVVLTGCGNVSNSSGAQEQGVDAKRIVQESVVAMEKMVDDEPTSQASKLFSTAFAPNVSYTIEDAKKNAILSSAINVYMSEYLVDKGDIDFGTTYKDSVDKEIVLLMEEMEDGVKTRIYQSSDTEYMDTRLYFCYDYDSMKPLCTICVQFTNKNIEFAQLDYKTNNTWYWQIEVQDSGKYAKVRTALEEKSFTFNTLVDNDIDSYHVAKVNVQNSQGTAYCYKKGEVGVTQDGAAATQDDAATLFSQAYSVAKDFLTEGKLDSATAKEKVFFGDMMSHGKTKIEALDALLDS